MTENPKQMDYPFPLDLLLSIGAPKYSQEWDDYLALDLTEEHVPDLIRMALDPELNWADTDNPVVYAPVHAWRALGQLRAQAAIEPLLALFDMFEDEGGSDWASEDVPEVYAMIGAAALPALSDYVLDASHHSYPRIDAAAALKKIAEQHPDFRDQCIAALMAALENYETNESIFNSLMIDQLIDLKAEPALPLIERVLASENVETFGYADWDDVQVEFGLKEADPNKQRDVPEGLLALAEILGRLVLVPDEFDELPDEFDPLPFDPDPGYSDNWIPPSERKAKAKAKSKRKQAAKSRKMNRKK